MVMNEVNTMTALQFAVQQHVEVPVESTDGPRCIYDVLGEGSRHGEFEMSMKQPHGVYKGA